MRYVLKSVASSCNKSLFTFVEGQVAVTTGLMIHVRPYLTNISK